MKIIPNFISPDIFKKMQDTVFASDFPFYYSPSITEGDAGKDFMFCHLLFHEQKQTSSYFNSLLTPLLGRLNFNYLINYFIFYLYLICNKIILFCYNFLQI